MMMTTMMMMMKKTEGASTYPPRAGREGTRALSLDVPQTVMTADSSVSGGGSATERANLSWSACNNRKLIKAPSLNQLTQQILAECLLYI